MPDFAAYDTRHYRTVDVVTGYDSWSDTYEDSVPDAMDLAVLDRLLPPDPLAPPHPAAARRVADLGCGTGRTAAWLRARGVTGEIDGVDLSPGMLARASERGAHTTLTEGDVRDTGLPTGVYDLVVSSLIDEHLPDLGPFYAEARRLVRPGGTFLLASYHPHFAMASGMPTHYTDDSGESVAITTHVHPVGDQIRAGLANGWTLTDMVESLVDDHWITAKPKWERFRGHPVSAAYVWRAA
ncbi:class I SAM-dependent methyltransferase [Nocardia puris]|uniref:Methyltransferase family protein n=1 Tax=Nocardia puris TaxID=208602 RepID=A0A366E1B6_9NOCA|nr:class I SAM-dependent methyltransferase [Nocardia puris]MBF6209564.1 class I SAM-dependent methyltransferase [Nocardia puris]MBF6366136.1 class I SAM-dependent methyltransferase [Nocardia puris]MBF6458523.1 class I SAM-dependent methyltransferase [Nocardia puris]RBO96171.1 methyltransferase family protein [Nocardia puris]